ncbi:DUF305 domain-containing protein [Planotetraspora sp. A-T 1434]|uniref:DUF305 domain-containing protein n=1 Tax=Planotetraspora sp. A-T 1434 TaxID=2979219 RepID=UPI0021BE0F19|nr:DUF305 domain-containing protein [Planotetraspora sp. A-T 1434]MCT9930004.1 DUF305 domain-containing protein [Planotetraspora sp. A-T 1434]
MTTETSVPLDTTPRPRRGLPIAGLVVVVVAAAVLMLFVTRSDTPGDASPEAGFARDMAIHHSQAVEMSFIVRDKTSDGPLRTLSYDIITTQTAQRGMFMGWLQQWGLTQASSLPPMAWMSGHGHGGGAVSGATPGGMPGRMPGMASDEEMNRLRSAQGKDAEVLFLQLMIRHHEGGVEMADGLLKLSDRPEVRSLAQHIVDGQTAEIRLMTGLLAERGAQPMPSILKSPTG